MSDSNPSSSSAASTSPQAAIGTAAYAIKLILAAGWTLAFVVLWAVMIAGMVEGAEADASTASDAGVGAAALIVSGCLCSVWGVGIAVLLAVYAVVRR